jgi:uncharacterized delta-60 repeat protein
MRLYSDSTLDNSFGGNGITPIEFNHGNDVSNAILEADGKITLAIHTYPDTLVDYYLALARYTADGQSDSTFGVNGIVTLNAYSDNPFKVFPDNNGYLSVYEDLPYNTLYLNRWNYDGSPDINFGTAGTILLGDFQPDDEAQQADGKLIIYAYNELRRYTSDGEQDSTFSNDGIALIEFPPGIIIQTGKVYTDSLNHIYVQYRVDSGGFNFYPRINRFLNDGSQDMTFGTGGNVDLGTDYDILSIDFNIAGKITIAGSVGEDDKNGYIIRLLDNGSLDSAFGTDGETVLSIPSTDVVFNDVICASGKVYTTGSSYPTSTVLVARFNDDFSTSSEAFFLKESEISVMPNPATTSCFIKSSEIINEVKIISTDGRTCISLDKINKTEAELNVSGLEPGIYFVQVRHQKSMTVRKFMIVN